MFYRREYFLKISYNAWWDGLESADTISEDWRSSAEARAYRGLRPSTIHPDIINSYAQEELPDFSAIRSAENPDSILQQWLQNQPGIVSGDYIKILQNYNSWSLKFLGFYKHTPEMFVAVTAANIESLFSSFFTQAVGKVDMADFTPEFAKVLYNFSQARVIKPESKSFKLKERFGFDFYRNLKYLKSVEQIEGEEEITQHLDIFAEPGNRPTHQSVSDFYDLNFDMFDVTNIAVLDDETLRWYPSLNKEIIYDRF